MREGKTVQLYADLKQKTNLSRTRNQELMIDTGIWVLSPGSGLP